MAINVSVNCFIEEYGLQGQEAIYENKNMHWYFDINATSTYKVTGKYKDACAEVRAFFKRTNKTRFGFIYLSKMEPIEDSNQLPEGVNNGNN